MIDSEFIVKKKKITVLYSFSGTGKSSLATEYGYRFKSKGFVYLLKSDEKNVENVELISFANNLGIYLSDREKIEKYSIIYRIKAKLQNECEKFNSNDRFYMP